MYKIYCPSYKRSDRAISHHLFKPDRFCYVVREEEEFFYRKKFPDVEIKPISKGMVKNIAETRNWILDNRETEELVMVDDDMTAIGWTLNRQPKKLSVEHVDYIIQNAFIMAADIDVPCWGMNVNNDPKAYSIISPFNFTLPILGPFLALRKFELRYDTRIHLKEDYDFFLQHIHKYRKVLRFNYLFYLVDHQKMPGGCQTYRNPEIEKEHNRMLQEKWGSDIVRDNYIHKDSINMIIRLGRGK